VGNGFCHACGHVLEPHQTVFAKTDGSNAWFRINCPNGCTYLQDEEGNLVKRDVEPERGDPTRTTSPNAV